MAREYVPVYFDWMKVTEELNDQEKGRLIDAIVLYAAGGDWQERIKGNERYLFPAFREQINRNDEISQIRASARSNKTEENERNGRNDNKTKENGTKITNDNKTKENESKSPKEEEKEEKKEKEKNTKKETDLSGPTKAELRFERFWKAYPKKVGKGAAEKSFMKYAPDDALTDLMIARVEEAKRSDQWQRDGGQYIPYPATWLNQRRWEDESTGGAEVPQTKQILFSFEKKGDEWE